MDSITKRTSVVGYGGVKEIISGLLCVSDTVIV